MVDCRLSLQSMHRCVSVYAYSKSPSLEGDDTPHYTSAEGFKCAETTQVVLYFNLKIPRLATEFEPSVSVRFLIGTFFWVQVI